MADMNQINLIPSVTTYICTRYLALYILHYQLFPLHPSVHNFLIVTMLSESRLLSCKILVGKLQFWPNKKGKVKFKCSVNITLSFLLNLLCKVSVPRIFSWMKNRASKRRKLCQKVKRNHIKLTHVEWYCLLKYHFCYLVLSILFADTDHWQQTQFRQPLIYLLSFFLMYSYDCLTERKVFLNWLMIQHSVSVKNCLVASTQDQHYTLSIEPMSYVHHLCWKDSHHRKLQQRLFYLDLVYQGLLTFKLI